MNHLREAWSLDEGASKHMSIVFRVGRLLSADPISEMIIDLGRFSFSSYSFKFWILMYLSIFPKFSNLLA